MQLFLHPPLKTALTPKCREISPFRSSLSYSETYTPDLTLDICVLHRPLAPDQATSLYQPLNTDPTKLLDEMSEYHDLFHLISFKFLGEVRELDLDQKIAYLKNGQIIQFRHLIVRFSHKAHEQLQIANIFGFGLKVWAEAQRLKDTLKNAISSVTTLEDSKNHSIKKSSNPPKLPHLSSLAAFQTNAPTQTFSSYAKQTYLLF